MTATHEASRPSAGAIPTSWQRFAALFGVAFVVFLALAWFLNGAVTPHYAASDHAWTIWAKNTEMKGRFAAFFALLAGLTFIPFSASVPGVLGGVEDNDRRSEPLALVASAGGLIGVTSFAIATVTFSGASAEGAQANPVVSRAIATGDVGPFLVAAMGLAAWLAAGGLLALRTGVLPRWTAVVALIGGVSFTITFLTTLDGTADGSIFGYGFFPGIVALITWSIAISVVAWRTIGSAKEASAAGTLEDPTTT